MSTKTPNDSRTGIPPVAAATEAIELGLYGKAAGILQGILDAGPKDRLRVEALLTLGLVCEARSEYQAAAERLREAINLIDTRPELIEALPAGLAARGYAILGYHLAEGKDPVEAERVLRKSLTFEDVDPDARGIALSNLGFVLSNTSRHAEAIEVRRALIPVTEASGYSVYVARGELANSLLAMERLEEAQEMIVRAIRSTPPPPAAELAGLFGVAAMVAGKAKDDRLACEYVREAEHYLRLNADPDTRIENALRIGRLALMHGEMEVLLRIGRMLSEAKDAAIRNEGVDYVARALYKLDRDEECLTFCEKESWTIVQIAS